ncbi:EAL domain-containing protein [Sphingomonas solaris]|uniref:bifunctional diguanylate cyclase/phosphodiesterase n=1 Tax=Alterirhizorhabdus solaris TaxID=2529389 RepID=UPI0019397560|nr:EAL domain-containing protein [Sphingomonas solaris]
MLPVLLCIRDDHDIRLVLLAGVICVMSAIASVMLLRHARDGQGDSLRWTAAAGLATGFGIWATHFVAMLGYDPGFVLGFHAPTTLFSLVVSVVTLTVSYAIALRSGRLRYRCLAGALAGCGIAAMHYIGMHAIELPAELRWAPQFVVLSVVFAIVPIPPALVLALDRKSRMSALWAGMLLGAAVLLLHFTGMAGVEVIPSAAGVRPGAILSPVTMGYVIGGVALAVLLICLITVLASARMRSAIRTQERQFSLLVQGINDCAIYMLDPAGRVMSWNVGAQRLKGYRADEIIGTPIREFYLAQDRVDGVPEAGLRHAREHGMLNAEGWRLRKDGSCFWAHVTIEAVHDARGVFTGYTKLTRDMTEYKASQDQLATLASNLDAALSNMHQGLCLFDADERLVMANARVGEMFAVSLEDCPIGTTFAEVMRRGAENRLGICVSEEVLDGIVQRHRAVIAQPGGGSVIVPVADDMTLAISHRPMAKGGWVTTFDDVTERYRADARIAHMAMHDELTGLPNRPNYNDLLDRALAGADMSGARVAVLGIDLDRFKEINDLHGHAIGDDVLRRLAERMRAICPAAGVVARFGGDEFAAFLPYRDAAALDGFLAALEACLHEPIEHGSLTIFPGASVGVALFPDHGTRRETIINNADLAMYRAKEAVGRRTRFYSQDMDEAARARRLLANDLREAIGRGELSLAYQVQRSISTDLVIGYEALLRWHHPRDGWISPTEFIPIAEESGEIVRIGEWVLRAACVEAASWEQPWRIAVNLSPVQLMQPDLIAVVTSALVSAGLPAHRLELEITETALIADKVRALHVLRQIKALGVTIAIDDFGTGYSSLDTLNSFPFDKIKIDRSFLMQSETSRQARAIIRAVLALGHSLEVPVLAEGLESEDQLRLLRSEGCDEAQGYYFGRPMPMAANIEFAQRSEAA